MKKFSILIALIIILAIAMPVFAAYIAYPDSTPTKEGINVYQHLRVPDDKLFLIYANIPYTFEPEIPVTQAYIWRLMGKDNVTVLGQTVGYAYQKGGYGYNVYSLYFGPTENVTWGQSYTLRLSGTPSAFAVPKEYNFPVNVAEYTSLTTQADNQVALTERILTLAALLNANWSRSDALSLLYESESTTVLSIFGESVFRGAIYGCQALAPAAFRMIVTDITAPDRTWTDNYTANLTGQYAGTWIEPAKTAGGTLFGLGYDLLSIIISIGLCMGIIYLNTKITHDHWNALVDVGIFLVCAPHIDLIPLSFTALICAIFILYEGTKVKSFVG